MSSLPPRERSRYAAELYNSKFAGMEWDMALYQNMHTHVLREGIHTPVEPPTPIGDDRHSPRQFHSCITYDAFFESSATTGDINAPINLDYTDLNEFGPLFGIRKADVVLERGAIQDGQSPTRVVLRTWIALYFVERLEKTELEDALVKGPTKMKALFEHWLEHATQSIGV